VKLPNWVLPGSAVFLLAACALLLHPAERIRTTAAGAGFLPVELSDKRLKAFLRNVPGGTGPNSRLTVYLESDGAPWRMPDEPPADPTPHKPMVLNMAIGDTSGAVAYLGRPCQYLEPEALAGCDPALWMRGRFSEDAVAAMDHAVSRLKKSTGAAEVNLVGYSGGGAMAALIAARRSDVSCLVTIAAPLDTRAWTEALKVSPLDYSLNPADVARKLSAVRQTHFRGRKDTVVPPSTTQGYLLKVPQALVIDKQAYDHQCCWGDDWPELRRESCLVR
jgi:pimeloyl-ACP methyl ester carboxylesterase